ncbi:response regulator [Litorilinea aerophila]|uniref:Sigma-54-dependent Fis family transcriptional regulator n=1 Tax=Litorilinea aerophila TaxID=1204385 RepID=A0A540VJZ7_9CHLR|nr:response regulator [Litorilinea aerophila]MCC9075515.1 response regulator [Litorilinea aerophila]GIV76401.1 MAG: sigma-54-dependent Fis family transcriptional regulator [Litorilinea sp.]
MARTVLVIDDEENMRWVLERALKKAGYDVLTAGRGEQGLQLLALHPVDLILLDLKMPGMDGLAVLREIRRRTQSVPVLLLTAYATVPTAVAAMQHGATDYLRKPFDLETVLAKINEYLMQQRPGEPTARTDGPSFDLFIGADPALERPLAQARSACEHLYPVLVSGEAGSGRRHLATLIHHQTAATRQGRLVVLDGASLSSALLRQELPPTEKGRWQEALGGSLLLANVDAVPDELMEAVWPHLQSFLRDADHPHGLRLLLTAQCLPDVWSSRLPALLTVQLPPLRERLADLPLLLAHFAPQSRWSQEAEAILRAYGWPGNVAEFQRVVTQAARAAGDGPVLPHHLPDHLRGASLPAGPYLLPPQGVDLEEVEQGLIRQALALAGGNKSQAARLLGLTRATLIYRMHKYGIQDDEDPTDR